MTLPSWVAHLRRTIPASTGLVTYTRPGVGSAPVGAILKVTFGVTDDADTADLSASYGVVDTDENERSSSGWSENNASTSVCQLSGSATHCIRLYDPQTGAIAVEARMDAWVTDGIRLNINTQTTGNEYRLELTLIFGTDAETHAFAGSSGTTITTGFRTTVMFTNHARNTNESLVNDNWITPGMAIDGSMAFCGIADDHNQTTTDTRRIKYGDRLNHRFDFSGTAIEIGTIVNNFTSTTFDIDDTGGFGNPVAIMGLACHLGDGDSGEIGVDMDNRQMPTSTGDRTEALGFKPNYVEILYSTTFVGPNDDSEFAASGHGQGDFIEEGSFSIQSANNFSGTSDTSQRVTGSVITQYGHNGVNKLYAATLAGRTTAGCTLNWNDVHATPRQYTILGIEELPFSGTGAGSFPKLTGTGTGSTAEPIIGEGAAILPLLTGTGTGALVFSGAGTATLPLLLGAGTGALVFAGSGTALLPLLVGAGTGALVFEGTGTALLPLLTGTGTGSLGFTGSGTAVLPLLTGAGTGALVFAGAGTATLPLLIGTGTGSLSFTGAGAAVLPLLQGTGTGALVFAGAGTALFPLLLGAGTGTVTDSGISGSGDAILPLLTGTGTGALVFFGIGTATLPLLLGTGAGIVIPPVISGTGDAILPLLTGTGVGLLRFSGSGAGVFPALGAQGTGALVFSGAGAATLPLLLGTGTGTVKITGVGAAVLPLLEGAGAGLLVFSGAGAAVFPLLTGTGSGIGGEILGCTTKLLGRSDLTTKLVGSFGLTTNQLGQFDLTKNLTGSYALSKKLAGRYDITTNLLGQCD